MDFITGSKALMALIVALAAQAEIPPELVLAIIEAESGGDPYATVFNPNAGVKTQLKRPALCRDETEKVHQRTAWGLMQVMGRTARGLGFAGWLSELVEPEINIRLGVLYLAQLKDRFGDGLGLDGLIAAYRKGAPRKTSEGKYTCQGYVDNVKRLMQGYEDAAAPYKAELAAAAEPETQEGATAADASRQGEPDEDEDAAEVEAASEPDAGTPPNDSEPEPKRPRGAKSAKNAKT